MYKLEIINEKGDILALTQNSKYQIISITGLNPPTASISTTSIIGNDGAILNNTRIDMRNIVITIVPEGVIETNRINLYKFFTPKKQCKLHYINGTRDVSIESYVESAEVDLFSGKQAVQVSLICLQPYFEDANKIIVDLSSVLNNFVFPFDIEESGKEFSTIYKYYEGKINNTGEIDTGLIIEMTALGAVKNPIIYDTATNEYIKINFEMQLGDLITINTYQGQKSITLLRSGNTTNIINHLDRGSTWLKVRSGDNVYYYDTDSGKDLLNLKFIHTNLYAGV